LLVFSVALFLFCSIMPAGADTVAPLAHESKIWYSSGDLIQDWTIICSNDPYNPGDENCTQDVGTPDNPKWCSEEGNISMGWRFWVNETYPGDTGHYNYSEPISLYNISYDSDEHDCNCTMGSPAFWNIGGDDCDPAKAGIQTSCCCGDDANEFKLYESDSPLKDSIDSAACCNLSGKCVDDNMCYADRSYHNIGETEDSGLATGDLEICDNGSLGYGDDSDWHDADDNPTFCSFALDPAGTALSCPGQPLGSCWVQEGEGSLFGGYENAANMVQTECCGDDDDEYYVTTGGLSACCNDSMSIVYRAQPGAVNCSHDNYLVTGHVEEETEDRSYQPSANANVSIQDISTVWPVGNMLTDASGNFAMEVPAGVYNIVVSKAGYKSYVTTVNFSEDRDFPLIKIDLSQDCRKDCSRAEYDPDFKRYTFRCDSDCDGINGCKYNNSVVLNDGRSMKDACDQKELGWRITYNTSYDITCCNQGYHPKIVKTLAEIRLMPYIVDAQSYYLGTYRFDVDGKLYSAYITIFTRE